MKCLFFGFHPFLPRETIFLSSGKHILLLFLFISTNGNDFLTIREQLFYILDPFLIAEPFFYLVQKSFIFSFQLFALVETISLSKESIVEATIFHFISILVSGNNFFCLLERIYFNFSPLQSASRKHFSILWKVPFFHFPSIPASWKLFSTLLESFPFIHKYFSLCGKCHWIYWQLIF